MGFLSPLPGLVIYGGTEPTADAVGYHLPALRACGHDVRTLGWSELSMVGHYQMAYCDYGADKGFPGKVKEPQRGVPRQPGASPREHGVTMNTSPERAA